MALQLSIHYRNISDMESTKNLDFYVVFSDFTEVLYTLVLTTTVPVN